MVESVSSSTQSIQDINAAYLAQYNARKGQSAAISGPTGAASFASQLDAVTRTELPAPTVLSAAPTSTVPQTQSATTPPSTTNVSSKSDDTDEKESCQDVKIARSDRMACAEQATHVNYEDDDFGIDDLVDLINPLQHIPLIGTIYRNLTGDTIKPEVQVAGSVLFGAATGSILLSTASGIASAVMEESTGKEPLVHVADALLGDTVQTPNPMTEPKVQVADASPSFFSSSLFGSAPAESDAAKSAASNAAGDVAAKSADVSTAASSAIKLAQATDNTQIAAETGAAKTVAATRRSSPTLARSGMVASTGASRLGNVIYASPMMKSAAKVPTTASATSVSSVQQTASSSASTESSGLPKANIDNATLGSLIQEQAKAHEAGQKLPPELVQDMMMMAMDKYKASHVASADTGAASVQVQ